MRATIAFGLLLILSRVWIAQTFEPESFTWMAAYKDVAHLFVGGLFTAWCIQRHRWQWTLFWVLNAVEIAAAIGSRM